MDLPFRMVIPCVVSLLMVGLLQFYLSRTFTGRAIMAVSQDQLALRLMAADPVRIKRIAVMWCGPLTPRMFDPLLPELV